MADVEIFTAGGVLAGTTARVPLTNDGPGLTQPLMVAGGRWYPIDGSEPSHRGDGVVSPDDILLIVTPEPELHVHMAWYVITLDVGPYRVVGSLATHPGFDPARAIARPSGVFVSLREARIELRDRPDAGIAERAHVSVNRYAVDRVQSNLMLGYFFPGATLAGQEAVPVA